MQSSTKNDVKYTLQIFLIRDSKSQTYANIVSDSLLCRK